MLRGGDGALLGDGFLIENLEIGEAIFNLVEGAEDSGAVVGGLRLVIVTGLVCNGAAFPGVE